MQRMSISSAISGEFVIKPSGLLDILWFVSIDPSESRENCHHLHMSVRTRMVSVWLRIHCTTVSRHELADHGCSWRR